MAQKMFLNFKGQMGAKIWEGTANWLVERMMKTRFVLENAKLTFARLLYLVLKLRLGIK